MSSYDCMELCRLCLVKDRVSVPIFEGEGDVRQIFLKIAACLPVKVGRDDKLPKKICDDCVYKVELLYDFWNTTANAEKQLLQWLGDDGGDKQGYVSNVMNSELMKQETTENRLDNSVMHTEEHQSNMNINMMDQMGLTMPIIMSTDQQITSVPMASSGNNIQPVPGTSSQSSRGRKSGNNNEDEEEESEEEENSDEECDNDGGINVKEENPDAGRNVEPSFVNVSIPCDEAGPSGLQQQKLSDISEIVMPQSSEGDPKSGQIPVHHFCPKCRIAFPLEGMMRRHKRFHLAIINKKIQRDPLTMNNLTRPGVHKNTSVRSHKLRKKGISKGPTSSLKRETSEMIDEETLEENLLEEIESSLPREPPIDPPPLKTSMEIYRITLRPKKSNSSPLKCDMCTYSCSKRNTLYAHKRKHNLGVQPEVFCCSECSFKTTKKASLYSHLWKKHKDPKEKEPELFSCSHCDYKNKNKYELKVHITRKHTDDYKFSCETCGKKFKVKGDLTNHVRFTHKEQPVICDVCGKTCLNSNSLYVHQKFAHYKAKYECTICKRRMVTQENLDEHMLRQHEKRENVVCEECGKSFSRNSRLKVHMRIHTGDRPYSCHVCNKAFARRTALKQHLLIHTGVRPYVCDICGKAFTQKPGLISHRKSHPGTHPPLPRVLIDHILNDVLNN